jgi:hypothetical protein
MSQKPELPPTPQHQPPEDDDDHRAHNPLMAGLHLTQEASQTYINLQLIFTRGAYGIGSMDEALEFALMNLSLHYGMEKDFPRLLRNTFQLIREKVAELMAAHPEQTKSWEGWRLILSYVEQSYELGLANQRAHQNMATPLPIYDRSMDGIPMRTRQLVTLATSSEILQNLADFLTAMHGHAKNHDLFDSFDEYHDRVIQQINNLLTANLPVRERHSLLAIRYFAVLMYMAFRCGQDPQSFGLHAGVARLQGYTPLNLDKILATGEDQLNALAALGDSLPKRLGTR